MKKLYFSRSHLNLLDLFVVWRRYTIQESGDLSSEVGCSNEGAKDVLW
jgi:hypothetical protein